MRTTFQNKSQQHHYSARNPAFHLTHHENHSKDRSPKGPEPNVPIPTTTIIWPCIDLRLWMTLLQWHWLFFSPKVYPRSALELQIWYLLVFLPIALFPRILQVLLKVTVTKETFMTTWHKMAITHPLILHCPALSSLFPSPSKGGNTVYSCIFLCSRTTKAIQ